MLQSLIILSISVLFATDKPPAANWNNIKSPGLTLDHQELSYGSYIKVKFSRSNFSNIMAKNSTWKGAFLDLSQWHRVDASNSDFRGTKLKRAVFFECIFAGTNFSASDLTETHFLRTDLRGANLENVHLYATKFEGSVYDKTTKLPFSDEMAKKLGMIKD